jgi:hypothetical protein
MGVVRFHAHNLSEAADIDFAGLSHFFRQCEDEFDFRSLFEGRLRDKIQATKTDIPRLGQRFGALRAFAPDAHGQTHRETPGRAAFRPALDDSPGCGDHVGLTLTLSGTQRNARSENPSLPPHG